MMKCRAVNSNKTVSLPLYELLRKKTGLKTLELSVLLAQPRLETRREYCGHDSHTYTHTHTHTLSNKCEVLA